MKDDTRRDPALNELRMTDEIMSGKRPAPKMKTVNAEAEQQGAEAQVRQADTARDEQAEKPRADMFESLNGGN